MGQNSSQNLIEHDYEVHSRREDGSILLRHKKNQNQFMLRNFTSNVEDEIEGLRSLLQKRQKIINSHLLQVVEVKRSQQKEACSTVMKMYILIEYPFKNLFDQMSERNAKRQHFSEDQLWSILYSCCAALNALYENKVSHQSLTSKEIYINKNGIIQLSDPLILGLEKNYIAILKQNQNESIHVSPEIMNFLDDCNFSYYDKDKSDIFILGAIMLEISLLKPIQLYDRRRKKAVLQQIPQLLGEVRNLYSQNYTHLIAKMLEMHSKMRPTFSQIVDKILEQNYINEDVAQIAQGKKALKFQNNERNFVLQSQPPKQQLQVPKLNFAQQPQLNQFHSPKLISLNQQPKLQSQPQQPQQLQQVHFSIPAQTSQTSYQYQSQIVNHPQRPPPPNLNRSQSLSSQKMATMMTKKQEWFEQPVVSSGRQVFLNGNKINPHNFKIQPVKWSKNRQNQVKQTFPGEILDKTLQKNSAKPSFPISNNSSTFKNEPLKKIKSRPELLSKKPQTPKGPVFVCELLEGIGRYEGYKENNQKNGKGILYFKDGGLYDGEWKDDKMHGYGYLYYETGQMAYEGQWQDDQFNGKGRVYNDRPEAFQRPFNFHDFAALGDKWAYYEGDFRNDSKDGYGKIQLTNGEVFEGRFVDDAIEGEGRFYPMNNQAIMGIWKDNLLTQM